jgi:hypothetical protein
MSSRNRENMSRVESRESRAGEWRIGNPQSEFRNPQSTPRSMLHAPRSSRRGVLLLVVLSLLVLFMLIGTAFLMSSNQYRKAAKASAKLDSFGNYPTKLLDRAVMHLLRDSENPQSAIRYHSLLRDLYGTDGFEAQVAAATYARQISSPPVDPNPLGVTQGQLIDIYVVPSLYPPTGATSPPPPTAANVIKLDRDVNGQPQQLILPLTKGYYNGCLLTINSGPARGQTTRIVDFDFVGGDPVIQNLFPNAISLPSPATGKQIWRFRVMAFSRADGSTLQGDATTTPPQIVDLITPGNSSLNATFIVNGRPFNGTGVGYNPFATAGQPRLNAVEAIGIAGTTATTAMFPEIALTPNSVYFFASDPKTPLVDPNPANDQLGARYPVYDPTTGKITGYNPLNPKKVALGNRAAQWQYQSFTGPGDADESYDAADFQNMYLGLQTVTPRAQGRVVETSGSSTATLDVATALSDSSLESKFLRLDLEDLPLPSFYRPDLENYWFNRLMGEPFLSSLSPANRAKAILQPFDASGNPLWTLSPQQAGQIAALKRKISLRPLREDHPHFDGSNPASRSIDLTNRTMLATNGSIGIPYWEAVGPWDVDNDNDGVPDSVWVDLGDPVAQAEDGTLYKPLYAFLVLDMDSRLNVNAHGLMSELAWSKKGASATTQTPPGFDPTFGTPGNLAHAPPVPPATPSIFSSAQLPRGLGYGPADISLRPALSPTLPTLFPNNVGDPGIHVTLNSDDFARIIVGRPASPSVSSPPGSPTYSSVWGRNGSVDIWNSSVATPANRNAVKVQPGMYFDNSSPASIAATTDPMTTFTKFGYPLVLSDYYGATAAPPTAVPTAFGTPPDLMGRYGIALGYAGQPVYEQRGEWDLGFNQTLLYNSPYDLNLADPVRRDEPDASAASAMVTGLKTPTFIAFDDDAPYATAELERVLRAYDSDTGALPDRLWSVVDSFDPVKLVQNQPGVVQSTADQLFGLGSGSPVSNDQALAAAQQMAGISRRLVTTDSYSLPVPSQNMPGYVTEAGPDGKLGTVDDFTAITGHSCAQATVVDLLHFRVFLDQRRQYIAKNGLTEPLTAAQTNAMVAATKNNVDTIFNGQQLSQQLLAPEVIAGQKMDLNRPFGDGEDNNNNGVVDEPAEAGDPYLDVNGNGKYDAGEPYIDADGDGKYTPPSDQLWQQLTVSGKLQTNIGFDYTNGHGEPIHPSVATGAIPATSTVRNLASESRQLFARQLYCLMLLLVDENYVVPIDNNDPQTALYIDQTLRNLYGLAANVATSTLTQAQITQGTAIARHKLTCRKIAQWAINVVDARDPDEIMTPFEYDENPWDGWGCPDASNPSVNIPLDGDPATDENKGVVIDWKNVGTSGKKVFTTLASVPTAVNQTRGVVWGVERPELLITEALALHDRRATDEGIEPSIPMTTSGAPKGPTPPPGTVQDMTLDQRLKPQGSLFVELYNPGSEDGQKPNELYRYPYNKFVGGVLQPGLPKDYEHLVSDPTNGLVERQGVLIHRLSDPVKLGSSPIQSPVWRLTIVKQSKLLPGASVIVGGVKITSKGKYDQKYSKLLADGLDAVIANVGANFHMLDVDSPEFIADGLKSDAERWVYFCRDPSIPLTTPASVQLRLPSVPVATAAAPVGGVASPGTTPTGKQYFLAMDRTAIPVVDPADPANGFFAPIMPGHYAVVGTAGPQYKNPTVDYRHDPTQSTHPPMFITTIGRLLPPSSPSTNPDGYHVSNMKNTRRIELIPQRNPLLQQVCIEHNGGPEWFMNGGTPVNVTDETAKGDHLTMNQPPSAGNYIQPCVAIPIARMNITEPVAGYVGHYDAVAKRWDDTKGPAYDQYLELYKNDPDAAEIQSAQEQRKIVVNSFGEEQFVKYTESNPDKAYPFEEPLDLDLDLVRNGTTPNYRSIHLQRLANPLLPWNPLPTYPDGTANSDFNAALAVNPYLTVDSSSVDMTAFNGATNLEDTLPRDSAMIAKIGGVNGSLQKTDDSTATGANQGDWQKMKRSMPYDGTAGGTSSSNIEFKGGTTGSYKVQYFHMKSLERGYHSKTDYVNNVTRVPRTLWDQERANVKQPVVPAGGPIKLENTLGGDLFDVVSDSLRRQQLANGDPANSVPPVPQATLIEMLPPTKVGTGSGAPVVDFVLECSLGFQNKLGYGFANALVPSTPFKAYAAGDFYTQPNPVPTSAYGAPKIGPPVSPPKAYPQDPSFTSDKTNASTFPWLAWNDRPYVSAEEITQVPAVSSSEMLRPGYYSTINPAEPAPANTAPSHNPYANDGQEGITIAAASVNDAYRSSFPFGHLLNFFAAGSQRRDPTTGNPLNPQPPGPNFNRILDFVQVPSRFVETDELLNADVFVNSSGSPITGPNDPRYSLQPPFNKVSREHDPGRVNLNTVLGRRLPGDGTATNPSQIWSEVYDGIMHRVHDDDLRDPSTSKVIQYGHAGPAFRDVELSRRGYFQFNADVAWTNNFGDQPPPSVEKLTGNPDVFCFGLNKDFPSFFSNPFRSADAGDLVPVTQMLQYGVDASLLRVHPYVRGPNKATKLASWGPSPTNFGDARDAGFGNDALSIRQQKQDPANPSKALPGTGGAVPDIDFTRRDISPLFGEVRFDPSIDTTRNPYMMYQPMTRLGNLVGEHSGVFAVWVTVGYFEVEKAPDWNTNQNNVQQRFGGDGSWNAATVNPNAVSVAARALYDRVYPEGYALAQEVGSDTGNTKRQRGFYIIDRTIPVGFKPGEDLNDDRAIKVRRRIE